MTPADVLTISQNAMFQILEVSAPILGAILAVGLGISLFQALTQLNETTLSFVPKLVAAVGVFATAGPWMLTSLVDFIRRSIQDIPGFLN